MDFFCKRGWIGKDSVKIGLWIELAVPEHQRTSGTAKSADVGEEIEMIQSDLKRLHSTHRKAGHGAMIAIGQRAEVGINVWNKRLGYVVLESRRHVLHRLHHFRRPKWLSGQVRRRLARAARVAISHDDNHGLAAFSGKQIVENKIRVALPDPAGLIFAGSMLKIEHRISNGRLRVVVRRRIHERVPPCTGNLRVVPNLANGP